MSKSVFSVLPNSVLSVLPPIIETEMKDKGLWDYKVFGPRSLDDPAEVTILVTLGRTGPVGSQTFIVPLGPGVPAGGRGRNRL